MAEEKNFENRVKKYLKDQGAWFVKYWGGAAFTKAGVPDILACVEGHFVGLELKASKGKATEIQLHTLKEIDKAGGIAILLYPQDFDSFKEMVSIMQEKCFTDAERIYEELKGRWC